MTIFDKENAILAGQVAQGQILSQIATAVANITTATSPSQDLSALQAAIAKVDAHVGQVQALIGDDSATTSTTATGTTATPTPAATATPSPTPAPTDATATPTPTTAS